MTETWRQVRGYDGRYEVSDAGNVRRAERVVRRSNGTTYTVRAAPVSVRLDGERYAVVTLRKPDGRQSPRKVHVLVCEAFRGPRPTPHHHAAHDDGNRADPALPNVHWKTRTENEADKVRHGTLLTGDRHPNSRLTAEQAVEARRLYAAGATQRELAASFQVSQPTIQRLVAGISYR